MGGASDRDVAAGLTPMLKLASPLLTPLRGCADGAKGQNRTGDTAVFSRVLYLLSYLGVGEAGLEPATPSV